MYPVGKQSDNTSLEELHEGHLGINRMKSLARSFLWWPNLDRDLENLGIVCERCQQQRNKPATTFSDSWLYPEAPWERVHADFAEYEDRLYLLLVDAHSKWLEIQEMGTHATAAQTIGAMRRVFSCHGLPNRLVTDNEPQFTEWDFQYFMRYIGIKHQLTPLYNPASIGQAERLVQEFMKASKSNPPERNVLDHISAFLLRYRTTTNTMTGKTPSELLMKQVLRTRLTLLQP